MAKVNLGELNNYVKSLYNQVNLEELTGIHAEAIRAWFIENMTKIGRYSNRDFERFGSLSSTQDRQGRQDGWVALTEEVVDPGETTYGTGALYIHGEMRIPGSTAGIKGDTFHHCSDTGQDFIKTPKSYGDTKGGFSGEDRTSDQGENEPDFALGFVWSFLEIPAQGGNHGYTAIIQSVSGIPIASEKAILPKVTSGSVTPSRFNDGSVYHLSNERNNYPWVIINSTQPKSIDNLLKNDINNSNGMYDRRIPWMAKGGYGPSSRIKVTTADRQEILNYISPTIDEYTPLPQTEDDMEQREYLEEGTYSNLKLRETAPWLPPIMHRTQVHSDVIPLPKGTVVSTRFTTPPDRFSSGQIVTIHHQQYAHFMPMVNFWISNIPNGPPIDANAIFERGIETSEMNYTIGWSFQNRVRLEPDRNYYVNIEDSDPYGSEPGWTGGGNTLLEGKIKRKVKHYGPTPSDTVFANDPDAA